MGMPIKNRRSVLKPFVLRRESPSPALGPMPPSRCGAACFGERKGGQAASPAKGLLGTETALRTAVKPTFFDKGPKISAKVFLGFGYWIVAEFGVRLAYRVSVASDFSFYDFTHLRDMTGMAKPTAVAKDSFIGTVPPNLGLDTHPQRGCPFPRCLAARGPRTDLSPRTVGPDSSR
jgi:hypothetical protein